MPQTLTGNSNNYQDTLSAPKDGDFDAADTFNPAFQQLLDNDVALKTGQDINTADITDLETTTPTADEKAALAGTGNPSSSNKYVTSDDPHLWPGLLIVDQGMPALLSDIVVPAGQGGNFGPFPAAGSLGSLVLLTFPFGFPAGLLVSGYMVTDNQGSIAYFNPTGASITMPTGTAILFHVASLT